MDAPVAEPVGSVPAVKLPLLSYWQIRGLAHPIRTLLAYTKTPYAEVMYGDDEGERARWAADKVLQFEQGVLFPNLPSLDMGPGMEKLTQSAAIMRFLGRKHNLLGKTEAESALCDLFYEETVDLRHSLLAAAYSHTPSFEMVRDSAPAHLQKFSVALGDRDFCAGSLSIVDFVLCETLAHLRAMLAARAGVPDVLAAYPKLAALVARFDSLPGVAECLAAHKGLPFNGASALFR